MADIQSTVEERGAVRRFLKVEIPAENVREEFDRAYAKLRGKAKIQGFRKGKVPRNVLEQHYGDDVRQDVMRHLIEHACADAFKEHELEPVANPELVSHILDEESGCLNFEAVVEVKPQFELGKYKELEAVRKIVRVDDSHVDETIAGLRERMAVLEPEEDRVNVALGDTIEFDMQAVADGQPVPSASGEGARLEVGAGRFPEEFEKQIVGVTRGIETPIDVHFPEDHQDAELAGKLVRFHVTVRKIQNKILPALDDEFAKSLGFDECETLEDLRSRVRADLEARAITTADRQMRDELLGGLVESHDFEVPETLVIQQIGASLREMGVNDVPEDKIDEIRSALEPQAIRMVRAGFILDAVAKAEGVEVPREDIESEVNRQLAMAGNESEKVRSYYSQPSSVARLHSNMLRDKALEKIAELATRRDETVEESQVAGKD
jgi:trigger factor